MPQVNHRVVAKIVDASRAILDGHITLSRTLADAGIYPAIDIESSVSRAMPQIVDAEQQKLVSRFRHVYSIYQEHRDLIAVGAYRRGTDPRVDDAVLRWPSIIEFLRQSGDESVTTASSLAALRELLDAPLGEEADARVPGDVA